MVETLNDGFQEVVLYLSTFLLMFIDVFLLL